MAEGFGRRLRDEGLDAGTWSNGPGDRYAAHEHGYDKVIVVERGSIRFGLPATIETIDLDAGDRLELPAGIAHDAIVGDLIYVPRVTPLLAAAHARGNRTVNGLGLLLNQARPAFHAWFGVMPSITPGLRQAIEATF